MIFPILGPSLPSFGPELPLPGPSLPSSDPDLPLLASSRPSFGPDLPLLSPSLPSFGLVIPMIFKFRQPKPSEAAVERASTGRRSRFHRQHKRAAQSHEPEVDRLWWLLSGQSRCMAPSQIPQVGARRHRQLCASGDKDTFLRVHAGGGGFIPSLRW